MIKQKNTKGITLIALVITIVVLLILAAVSIAMLTGQNGILTKAQSAQDKTNVANVKEKVQTEVLGSYDTTGKYNPSEAKSNMEKNLGATVVGTDDLTVTLDGYKITVDKSGNVGDPVKTDGTTAKTLVQAFKDKEIKIGDYLDYQTPETGSYTSLASENGYADQTYDVGNNGTEINWRVLGLSEDGAHVLLIAGSPVKKVMNSNSSNDYDKNPYLYMKSAESYVNCNQMLNGICAIYKNDYADEARSMTIEDINRTLGVVVESNKVYLKSDSTKTNIDQSETLGNTYTYTSTDYTPSSYLNSGAHATAGETVTQDAYYYDYTSMSSNTIGNTTLGDLLFSQTTYTNGPNTNAKTYWLASPGVIVGPDFAYFGPGGVRRGLRAEAVECSIRMVIGMPMSVQSVR